MDRNHVAVHCVSAALASLSARRAWIEIASSLDDILAGVVALRKESVDRNDDLKVPDSVSKASLSARRAWIEIPRFWPQAPAPWVALRKESVDRNRKYLFLEAVSMGRSPQGERG